MSTTILSQSLDDVFQGTSIGSLNKAIGNNLFGIDHTQMPTAVPSNKEHRGYIFIVRPQLNMQAPNLRNFRKLNALMSLDPWSTQRWVRATLDPRIQYGYNFGGTSYAVPPLDAPLVDPYQAFIPVFTNNALTLSGWPDLVTPTFTSKPGRYRENYTQVDGLTQFYEAFTLDLTVRDTLANPALYLIYCWQNYMSAVLSGKMVPYPDLQTDWRLDYTSRMYRVILDKNKRKVTKILSTGKMYPIALPSSVYGDYDASKPYFEQNKELTFRFQVEGFEMYDDILIDEFNWTVGVFNNAMKDMYRDQLMYKVEPNVSNFFRHRVYPRIDPRTHEMQWWASKELYQRIAQAYLFE